MSLRLRQGIQTLKASKAQGIGLFDRGEWEGPAPDGALDLDQFKDTPLSGLDLKPGDLLPIIQIDVERSAVVIDWQKSRIELSLDQGTVWADSHQAPLCELEFELVAGQPSDLFDLVMALGQSVRIMPALTSKGGLGLPLPATTDSAKPIRDYSPDIFRLKR